jgi:hypothetical protein
MRGGPVAQVGHFSGREKEEEGGHKVEQLTKKNASTRGLWKWKSTQAGRSISAHRHESSAMVHTNSKYAMRIQRPLFFLDSYSNCGISTLEQGTRELW